MNDEQKRQLTSGFLPLTAFQQLDPTAVGVVDLERAITPRAPDGRAWDGRERDGLLLVRLHDEPLGVVHIDGNLRHLSNEELAREVWRTAGAAICGHITRFRCAPVPATSAALIDELPRSAGKCPGERPAEPRASVAAIICTVGREDRLGRCLRSLLAQRGAEFEVVVVDNRPDTGDALRTVRTIAADDSRVRYVAERRVGLSVARNRGVNETEAELVAFTDDDVVVDPGWLGWIVAPFAESEVTATSGMVLPLELQTEAQKRFERYGGFSKGVERHTYDMHLGRAARPRLYPFLGDVFGGGNSMAFRRVELIAAGGFDPALGAGSPTGGGEDIYALSTAILRGGRVVYEPRALCWHEHRKEDEALRAQVFSYGVGLGAIMAKALIGDRRFYPAVARAMPVALGLDRRRRHRIAGKAPAAAETVEFRDDLRWAHRKGIVQGPLRYAEGVVRSHRLRLGEVIRGT